ncbi:MAG TPA: prepilin-type N-terminal cleavage/methylation domain-containing protein [Candidatus Methylomirabilis sp.]|nr:prepilin-type N-terminal cleavage/methylation domain-containing protein [Candidatus Methylomirabilis sp.]
MKTLRKRSRRSTGFSLLEAIIAIVVLSVGVLSLAAVYAQGIMFANSTQFDYIAEKKAEEAVETIFTARDTKLLTWAQIQNASYGGVFLDGPRPLLDPGQDGLVGTADDNAALPDQIIVGPGPDGILGTPDDEVINLNPWMTRTIAITPVQNEPNLRQITVTINYTLGQNQRTYTLITYISAFA